MKKEQFKDRLLKIICIDDIPTQETARENTHVHVLPNVARSYTYKRIDLDGRKSSVDRIVSERISSFINSKILSENFYPKYVIEHEPKWPIFFDWEGFFNEKEVKSEFKLHPIKSELDSYLKSFVDDKYPGSGLYEKKNLLDFSSFSCVKQERNGSYDAFGNISSFGVLAELLAYHTFGKIDVSFESAKETLRILNYEILRRAKRGGVTSTFISKLFKRVKTALKYSFSKTKKIRCLSTVLTPALFMFTRMKMQVKLMFQSLASHRN